VAARVREARPTAVNLAWAVDRVLASDDMMMSQSDSRRAARHRSRDCRGRAGTDRQGRARADALQHGPIATAGGGTALGVVIEAQRAGKHPHVFVDETRPLLQGARLTYFELERGAWTRP